MSSYHWHQVSISLTAMCCCLMALPRLAQAERLEDVLACGAFIDRRYRENQQDALANIELQGSGRWSRVQGLWGAKPPPGGGHLVGTCTVSPKSLSDKQELEGLAENLGSTFAKCIQAVFVAAPKGTWGRGVVQVKLTKSGSLQYLEHFGEPSSKYINKAIACVKRKQGTKHSVQVASENDVYILHRWSFSPPYRGIWQAGAEAKSKPKETQDQVQVSRTKPKRISMREARHQATMSRFAVSLDVSYSEAPTAKAKALVEAELRKTAGCVVERFLRTHRTGAVKFRVVFSANGDGLVTAPILLSMSPEDKKLRSCVRANAAKLEIAKDTFGEPTAITADVRVTFQ